LGDGVKERVAFGGRVLGVATDVEIQTAAVFQEHVARATPSDNFTEKEARDFVRAQAALAAQREGDAILGFDAVDPS